jgi:hypothetical protein
MLREGYFLITPEGSYDVTLWETEKKVRLEMGSAKAWVTPQEARQLASGLIKLANRIDKRVPKCLTTPASAAPSPTAG